LSCEPVKASESASVAVIKGAEELADRTGDPQMNNFTGRGTA